MPVLDVLHELINWEQVTGPVEDGTINDTLSSQVTLWAAAAELSGVNGRGAKGTVTTAFFTPFLMYIFKLTAVET